MLVMVKAGRARRNGKVTTVRSGTLAKASKGACSWVETAKLSAQECGVGDIGNIFSPGRPEDASVPLGSCHRPLSFHMLLRFFAVSYVN